MSLLTPDLVGFTNAVNYIKVDAAEVDADFITQQVEDVLTGAGWTVISKTVGALGHYDYELYSAQSPWYDSTNVPSWYVGGRVWLKITHYSTSSEGWLNQGFYFQVGEYYSGAAVNKSASNIWVNYGDFGYGFHVWANPYEFRFWGEEDTYPAPNPLDPTDTMYNRYFYCSALNVPRPILQGDKVITSITAQGYQTGVQQYFYYIWRTTSLLYNSFMNADNLNQQGRFPPTTNLVTSNAVWVPSVDAGMATRILRPFMIPSFVIYRPQELAAGLDISRIYGFLWDSFYLYSPYTTSSQTSAVAKNTLMSVGGHTFMSYMKLQDIEDRDYPSFWVAIT